MCVDKLAWLVKQEATKLEIGVPILLALIRTLLGSGPVWDGWRDLDGCRMRGFVHMVQPKLSCLDPVRLAVSSP